MKEAFYFPHDANARRDPKILDLRSVYGWEGYGMFFAIIELLREQGKQNNYSIEFTPRLPAIIAEDLNVEQSKVTKLLEDDYKTFHLFSIVEEPNGIKKFTSLSLKKRMAEIEEKALQRKQKAEKAAIARWNNSNNTQALLMQSSSNANERKLKERKLKENIIEKNIEKKTYGEFKNVLLTDEDYKNLTERFNSQLGGMIESLSAWLEANGKRKKNYYATLLNWGRNNANGTNPVRQNAGTSAGKPETKETDWHAGVDPGAVRRIATNSMPNLR